MIIDMTISRSSVLSINVLLIFDMHNLNATYFSALSFLFVAPAKTPTTASKIIYASL